MALPLILASSECLKRLRQVVPLILDQQATLRISYDPHFIYWQPVHEAKLGFGGRIDLVAHKLQTSAPPQPHYA